MSDVLDDLEAALFASPRGVSVPTPATPRERIGDDGRVLRRPVALASIARCLDAQRIAPPRGVLRRALGADPLSPEGRRWYQVATDELRLATMLTRGGWSALHSLPIGKTDGDLDHLVIGGFGAVAVVTVDAGEGSIEVRDGELCIDGVVTRDLDRAAEVREDVASRLGVALGRAIPVAVAVVVLGRRAVRIMGRPPVPVLTAAQLQRWLWRRDPVLTDEEIAEVRAGAELASVWRPRPAGGVEEPTTAIAFADLDAEVHRARRRRTLWESAGLTMVLAVLAAVATGAPAALAQAVASLGG